MADLCVITIVEEKIKKEKGAQWTKMEEYWYFSSNNGVKLYP